MVEPELPQFNALARRFEHRSAAFDLDDMAAVIGRSQ